MKVVLFCFGFVWAMLFSQCREPERSIQGRAAESGDEQHSGYLLQPVDIRHVKLEDDFWLPVIQKVQGKTIEYAINKCREEGRFDNFLIAGGRMDGEVKGAMPFDDTDVYKIIEGASYSLISAPNKKLSALIDSLVAIIKTGQEEDGYLTTWRTIDPARPPAQWVEVREGKRWESLGASHELYNAGHLYEAAAAHYQATGKRNFLDIALKNANLMVSTFGDSTTKIQAVPGHQIIETGLIKLFQITKNEDYLNLAKYFLDNRGKPENHELFGPYSQDHVPVTIQQEAVGHAVRAVYMYAAMTDIAALKNDSSYAKAVNNLWNNMVSKKMYVTGGIGARHESEAFGENYELPNLTAYSETCAAIGSVYWNHRLHSLYGSASYFDVIERTMYNGLLSGLALNGEEFFYPNALESDGVYKFNRGACSRQSWFDCSCCPTNLIRFIPSIPGLIYSKHEDSIYVNLYASSKATIEIESNTISLVQETDYPWNGVVNIRIDPKEKAPFTLKLRVPGWARNEVLPTDLYSYKEAAHTTGSVLINGKRQNIARKEEYVSIAREWEAGDVVTLELPMEIQKVVSHDSIAQNRGKVALEYGPIVYAIEEVDNPVNFDRIKVTDEAYSIKREEDLLGGVNTINGQNLKAIPYYSWSNRGVGKMKVWIKYKNEEKD